MAFSKEVIADGIEQLLEVDVRLCDGIGTVACPRCSGAHQR